MSGNMVRYHTPNSFFCYYYNYLEQILDDSLNDYVKLKSERKEHRYIVVLKIVDSQSSETVLDDKQSKIRVKYKL